VALVTGASRGIGRAIALAVAEAGADVALAGRTEASLCELAAEIEGRSRRAIAVAADVTSEDSVRRLFARVAETLGPIDLLVNNAGVIDHAPVVDASLDAWRRVLDTNVTGTFLCTREAGAHMLPQGRGKIVNIASNMAFFGVPGFAAYCASKAAIVNFTRAVALEWAGHGVQVNAIAPGYVETDMNALLRDDEAGTARVLRRIPAGRMATPDEIAQLAVFLLTPAADFVIGETVICDGGEIAR
jgi:2-deoxy-D-gluconate 3-dehydrogenase